jgi:hypothetical protein
MREITESGFSSSRDSHNSLTGHYIETHRRLLTNATLAVRFLLGNYPASEFYMPTFRNPLSVPSSWKMNIEQSVCSETSAYKIQTPGNYPEESIQHSEHGESFKSGTHSVGPNYFQLYLYRIYI